MNYACLEPKGDLSTLPGSDMTVVEKKGYAGLPLLTSPSYYNGEGAHQYHLREILSTSREECLNLTLLLCLLLVISEPMTFMRCLQ